MAEKKIRKDSGLYENPAILEKKFGKCLKMPRVTGRLNAARQFLFVEVKINLMEGPLFYALPMGLRIFYNFMPITDLQR